MIDRVISFFLNPPSRLVDAGKLLFEAGRLLGSLGLVGWVGSKAASIVSGMAGQGRHDLALADLFPNLPTWWVPEGPLGFGCALALMVVGWQLAHVGHEYERILR